MLLRYPGGKSRAVSHILPYIPANINEVCSPFFGGGTIEIVLSKQNKKIYGYDLFEPLVCFWNNVLNNKNRLVNEIQKYFPITSDIFYSLQKKLKENNNISDLEKGAIFFVLNRSSFSGTTLSGGISPNTPRFTQSSIERIKKFNVDNISIECLSFEKSIEKHNSCFLFLDPPYFLKNKSNLYGKSGDLHKTFDHFKLFDILKQRNNWLLCYNNCPEILELYKDYEIIYPEWMYGMSKNKISKEVLIRSL